MRIYNIYNSSIDKRVLELKNLTENFKNSDEIEPIFETIGHLLFSVNGVLNRLCQPGLIGIDKYRIKQVIYSLEQLALEIHDFEHL